MRNSQAFLDGIDEPEKRDRMEDILNYIKGEFPQLEEVFKWNQPMFTDHGTFIIGFSIAKDISLLLLKRKYLGCLNTK